MTETQVGSPLIITQVHYEIVNVLKLLLSLPVLGIEVLKALVECLSADVTAQVLESRP